MRVHRLTPVVLGALALGTGACGGTTDPVSSGGKGSVAFTTWGEEYIEDGIPGGSDTVTGFVDGWSVRYEKFLVAIGGITVGDTAGTVGGTLAAHTLFDHVTAGVKTVGTLKELDAREWDAVGYSIAPVTGETALDDSATADDRTLMADGAHAVYAAGTARKGDVTKHFAWGFAIGTAYRGCHSEQGGKDEAGIVVTRGKELDVELTIHGDHLFYDRLQASDDPAVPTSLRFEALAAADANGDDEITREELNAAELDVLRYDPSGLRASNHGEFVEQLARTVGHFRGEGECEIAKL